MGVMKGVMHRILMPDIPAFFDITHHVSPYGRLEAAWKLYTHFSYFPKGTVFLVVVDPGVGSKRAAVAAETEDYTFVAPDNGVLDLVLTPATIASFIRITESRYIPKPSFSTFHGRDIFAPAAAYLAKGVISGDLGEATEWKPRLALSSLQQHPDGQEGEILFFDSFGNAFTNIPLKKHLTTTRIVFRGESLPLVSHFAAADPGTLSAVRGSAGYLELFVNQGNAQMQFELQKGEHVRLYR